MPNTNNNLFNEVQEATPAPIAPVSNEVAPETTQPARISNPIYMGVKAKSEVVRIIKQMVKCGYFRKNPQQKAADLNIVAREVCRIYNIPVPTIMIGGTEEVDSFIPNRYDDEGNGTIHVKNHSIVSFLHEFRHHMQHFVPESKYQNMTIEEDAKAWSLRVYYSACPNMFKTAVQKGRLYFLEWDEENQKVVNAIDYKGTLEEATADEAVEKELLNQRLMFAIQQQRAVMHGAPITDIMGEAINEYRSRGDNEPDMIPDNY